MTIRWIFFFTTYKGITYQRYDTLNHPFCPWLWLDKSDYFRLAFECVDATGKYYKVRLNETEFGWIKKTDNTFKKESIKDFVLSWTMEPMGLDFNREINPLREKPKDSGEIIQNQELSKYKIWQAEALEMKGDWLKIKTIKGEIGWIKWRDGKKVLIRMYYLC